MSIEENTKALNRLTNTLLGIFGGALAANTTALPLPVVAAAPPAAPTPAATVKAPPAPAKPAAVAPPLVPTRLEISGLLIKYAAIGGRDKAVALLAGFRGADGGPAKSISKGDATVKDADLREISLKLIDLLGPAAVAETLKAASAAK